MLELRPGTQVLLTTNLDVQAGLVNGSRGVVIDFEEIHDEEDEEELEQKSEKERWKSRLSGEFVEGIKGSRLPKVLFANGDIR
jgi:hypothetical protein